jgi:hypothetical protein
MWVWRVEKYSEDQVLSVDEASVFQPPSQLQMPTEDVPASASDSAVSAPDSDDNSSDNSDLPSPGPRYADEESQKDRRVADSVDTERKLVSTSPYCALSYSYLTLPYHAAYKPGK